MVVAGIIIITISYGRACRRGPIDINGGGEGGGRSVHGDGLGAEERHLAMDRDTQILLLLMILLLQLLVVHQGEGRGAGRGRREELDRQ